MMYLVCGAAIVLTLTCIFSIIRTREAKRTFPRRPPLRAFVPGSSKQGRVARSGHTSSDDTLTPLLLLDSGNEAGDTSSDTSSCGGDGGCGGCGGGD